MPTTLVGAFGVFLRQRRCFAARHGYGRPLRPWVIRSHRHRHASAGLARRSLRAGARRLAAAPLLPAAGHPKRVSPLGPACGAPRVSLPLRHRRSQLDVARFPVIHTSSMPLRPPRRQFLFDALRKREMQRFYFPNRGCSWPCVPPDPQRGLRACSPYRSREHQW